MVDLLRIRECRGEPVGVDVVFNGKRHRANLVIVVIRIERRPLPRLERDELAHRLVGRNPGASAHRPARAVLHLEGEPLAVALRLGEFDEVRPLLAQAGNRLGDARLERRDVRGASFRRRLPADNVKPRLRRTSALRIPDFRRRRESNRQAQNENESIHDAHDSTIWLVPINKEVGKVTLFDPPFGKIEPIHR